MHVLMLGWEFPPFIAGGLGTACHGLTKAMDRRGLNVTFVLPKAIDRSQSSHVNLISPEPPPPPGAPTAYGVRYVPAAHRAASSDGHGADEALQQPGQPWDTTPPAGGESMRNVQFVNIPAGFASPYQRPDDATRSSGGWWVTRHGVRILLPPGEEPLPTDTDIEPESVQVTTAGASAADHLASLPPPPPPPPSAGDDYGGDLMQQVERFAHFCMEATRNLQFDVIHAHDWMTYPAGLFIASATGKPLVVHVHSTEFDRSGIHVNQRIYNIERRGMHGAMRVIAVSQLTKHVVVNRYSVPEQRVEVVYNGVDLEPTQGEHVPGIQSKDKIVLYFGRITYQKGPEYFIQAAKRVLDVMPDVKFVVAGSGDQAARMIEMAAKLGIGHKVLFTGFLRGRDIKRVFALADLYVMPSVSEPFGIAPLEAMAHDVPTLISKSSGVSELLTHVLKVDFWDIEDMANKIVAVLRYPPLSQTLKEHGAFEVRRITWDGAAARCEDIYRQVIAEMTSRNVPSAS